MNKKRKLITNNLKSLEAPRAILYPPQDSIPVTELVEVTGMLS